MDKLRHYEDSVFIPASAEEIFRYIDDHSRFSSHMSQSSWMMGGGRMDVQVDEGKGQKVGSHIRISGKVLGLNLFLDEVVTEHNPPYKKVWETVGKPKLFVIGNYQMGVEITPENGKSRLKVFIDYEQPVGTTKLLGYLFGSMYAKWCVRQMLDGVRTNFNSPS